MIPKYIKAYSRKSCERNRNMPHSICIYTTEKKGVTIELDREPDYEIRLFLTTKNNGPSLAVWLLGLPSWKSSDKNFIEQFRSVFKIFFTLTHYSWNMIWFIILLGFSKIGWTLMIIIEKIYIYMIGQFWWLLRFLLISTIGLCDSRDQVICYSGGQRSHRIPKSSQKWFHTF